MSTPSVRFIPPPNVIRLPIRKVRYDEGIQRLILVIDGREFFRHEPISIAESSHRFNG